MAEGVFRSLTASNPRIGEIDSAGTGAYHTLEPPDYRTMQTLRKNGISDYDHGARKVENDDFESFDYVFAMDGHNLRDLQRTQRRLERAGHALRDLWWQVETRGGRRSLLRRRRWLWRSVRAGQPLLQGLLEGRCG